MLTEDRSKYKEWHSKFSNTVGQVRPGGKDVILWLNKFQGDTDDIEIGDVLTQIGKEVKWDRNQISDDLYAILLSKTSGDIALKVQSSGNDGLTAHVKIRRWFTDVSGMALAERRRQVICPAQVKKDEDVAAAIGKWLK